MVTQGSLGWTFISYVLLRISCYVHFLFRRLYSTSRAFQRSGNLKQGSFPSKITPESNWSVPFQAWCCGSGMHIPPREVAMVIVRSAPGQALLLRGQEAFNSLMLEIKTFSKKMQVKLWNTHIWWLKEDKLFPKLFQGLQRPKAKAFFLSPPLEQAIWRRWAYRKSGGEWEGHVLRGESGLPGWPTRSFQQRRLFVDRDRDWDPIFKGGAGVSDLSFRMIN